MGTFSYQELYLALALNRGLWHLGNGLGIFEIMKI